MHRTRIILTLEPMASNVPAEVRIRRMLKIAGRYLSLRCIDIRESKDDAPPSATPKRKPRTTGQESEMCGAREDE